MICIDSDLYKTIQHVDVTDMNFAGIRALRFSNVRKLVAAVKFRNPSALRDYAEQGPVIYFPRDKIIVFDDKACVISVASEEEARAKLNALLTKLKVAGIVKEEAVEEKGKEKKRKRRKEK